MHESIDSSSLRCDGPGGSAILATSVTLNESDYGDGEVHIPGGPETIDLFCELSKYYNTKADGTGECLPFEGGPCNDEYCAENGVDGDPVGGITSREDCLSPNVWVGKYHSNRNVDSAGSCNICDLTMNTIDYEGGSRSSFYDSLECNACEPGASRLYVSNDGECEECPDDHIYDQGPPATCTECTGGRKYIDNNICLDCPNEKYYNATNTTCVDKIGGGLNHPCGTRHPQNKCNDGFECNEQYVPSESVCKISLYNAGGGICRENADCIGHDRFAGGGGINRDCSSATMMSGDRCVD
jgi:hypothetical protein